MIMFGYAKGVQYGNDGTMKIRTRIPSIHGPFKETANTRATYTRDEDLPWLTSLLLPHMPAEGEVVALQSVSSANSSDYIVIGITGGSYYTGFTIS